MTTVPAGFEPHFRKSALTDPWEPLYSKVTDEAVVLGLRAGPQHCNARGFVHGGLIAALADNAMGLSCTRRHEDGVSLVTVNLALDYLTSAEQGQWLAFRTDFVRTGRAIDVAQCFVLANERPVARANATFRVRLPRGGGTEA